MVFRAILLGVLATAAALSGAIDYPDFQDTTGLIVNGDAAVSGDTLILTDALEGQASSVFYQDLVPVGNDFETFFRFRISELDGVFGGADGLAFVIQGVSPTALGTGGNGLGYDGIGNCLAIEFDTFQIGSDPDGNHISVQSGGGQPNSSDHSFSLGWTSSIPNLSDENEHYVRISYRDGILRVYIDDIENPVLQVAVNIDEFLELNGGGAYVGFTGATGGGYQLQELFTWNWFTGAADFHPDQIFTVEGEEFTGGLSSLIQAFDNDVYLAFNDVTSLATGIVVTGASQVETPHEMAFGMWAACERRGLAFGVEFLGGNGTWYFIYGTTFTGSLGLSVHTGANFWLNGNGECAVRFRWYPINDEDPSQDGWTCGVDYAQWTVL